MFPATETPSSVSDPHQSTQFAPVWAAVPPSLSITCSWRCSMPLSMPTSISITGFARCPCPSSISALAPSSGFGSA
jgi:hypothetical protein